MSQTRNESDLNVIACNWIGFSQRCLEAKRTMGRHMGILLTEDKVNGRAMRKGYQVGQGIQMVIEVLSIGIRFTRRQYCARLGEILHARTQPIRRRDDRHNPFDTMV